MTNTERRQYILDYIKNSSVEAFTNLRLQTLLLELNDDLTAAQTTDTADTTALQLLSGANFTYVIVTGSGIYKYASSGTPNGTTIFAATGGGVWSLVFNAGVDTPQLSTPVLTLTVISDTQINATWPSVTDAANYQLYRATAIDFTGETLVYDGALLLFNSTGLSASTTYYFRLKARGYERMNSAFDTDSAATQAMPQLATPTGFAETGVTSTTIDYNWNDVASATNYIVERSASGAGVFTQIYSGATSAHTDTGRTASTTYDYRCKAQAAGFTDSAWATDSATTGAELPGQMSAPSYLSEVNTTPSSLWLGCGLVTTPVVPDAYVFEIFIGASWVSIFSGNDTYCVYNGLTPSTSYNVRVKAQGAGYADSTWRTATISTAAFGTATNPTEAILVISTGQSQNVGLADADAPNEVTVPANVYEYRPFFGMHKVEALAEPTGQYYAASIVRGNAAKLGQKLNELTGKPVIILQAAKGSTSIENWSDTGSILYRNAKAWWDDMVAYCALNGITILGKYNHYQQGENNVGNEALIYMTKLSSLADQFTADFGFDMNFHTRIGYATGSVANDEKIMLAQNRADLIKDNLLLTTKAASQFTIGNSKMKADNLHYTLLGNNEIGNDVAVAMNRFYANNKKVYHTAEPVVALQDAGGFFDDIYLYRSLKSGVNADFTELYGRNNLTNSGSGATFRSKKGVRLVGSNPTTPVTVRELLNSHDWTIEITGKTNDNDTNFISNGRSTGSYITDYISYLDYTFFSIKGNGVTKTVAPTGVDFNLLHSLALVYTSSGNSLGIYYNGTLKQTVTDWSFTSIKLDAFFRGQFDTPVGGFNGDVERIRIVKRALNPAEFDQSPNIGVNEAFDWSFPLAPSSLAEAEGDTTLSMFTYAGVAKSPAFDADGLLFNENEYGRFAEKKSMPQCTIEFDVKSDASGSGSDFYTGNRFAPVTTGANGGISRDGNDFRFGTVTGNAYFNLASLGLTYTNFNNFKIVYNGTTAALYINGSLHNTVAVTGNFEVAIIGAKTVVSTDCFKGTMKNFKLKNSI